MKGVVDVQDKVRKARSYAFDVLLTTKRLQAAFMSLGPGEDSGEDGMHEEADQLVYVLSGEGEVVIEGKGRRLVTGALMVIPHGKEHRIYNRGRVPMTSLNVYAPPEYPSGYEE